MRIYLDHNATTPLRDEVVDAMVAVLRHGYGNPSSSHREGAAARRRVDDAREQVAEALGAAPGEITFTAGATEANNAVLQALCAEPDRGRHLVTTRAEHPSVLEPAAYLETRGFEVTWLPVDAEGLLDPQAVAAAVREDTALVSVLWANNETGVVQPMEAIAQLVKERGALLHVDATQAVGKWPVDVGRVPVDLLACSAHKLNGPKGVGCLFARQDVAVPPLLRGGPQEKGLRGGTENTSGVAGFGAACELARRELPERMERYAALRDRLWEGIRAKVSGVRRNGSAANCLPNTLNVELADTAGEVLLQALDLEGVAASAGAACHSGSITPSHVLSAMGRTPDEARGSLRLSVGHGVDEMQIDRAIELLAELVPRVRGAGVE
ncbi:MAG: cysteine desulfurase family protein [Proteobacteria bacterium]|nr:cysteine desulfurase family protein [Pseudomonadota bacterium]